MAPSVIGHRESPFPKLLPAQPPQKLVLMTIVWLKNLSPKDSEHGPEKVVLGRPNVEVSGSEYGDVRLRGTAVGSKNQILITEFVHSKA